MEDDLKKNKKNGRRPKKNKNEDNQKKNGKRPKQKWKTNQSTKINLIGCDTIVNSPSSLIATYISHLILNQTSDNSFILFSSIQM